MTVELKSELGRKILFAGLAIYSVFSLVSMAVMNLGLGVFALTLIASIAVERKQQMGSILGLVRGWRKNRDVRLYFVSAFFLALACFLSLLVAKLFPLEYAGIHPEITWITDLAKLYYLFLPLFMGWALVGVGERYRNQVVKIWMSFAMVLFALGVFQHFFGWPRPIHIPGHERYFHANLFMGHHLSVASTLIFPFFMLLEEWFFRVKGKSNRFSKISELSKLVKWAVPLALGLALVMFYATFSRTLWIALPVGICFFAWKVLDSKKRWLFLGGVVILLIAASFHPVISTRVRDSFSFTTRADLWRANFEFFVRRPFTGIGWHHNLQMSAAYFMVNGYKAGTFVGHAHNLYLEIIASTGLFGLGGFIVWIAVFLKNSRQTVWSLGLKAAMLVFLINGITQVNFWESKVLHQLMWVSSLCLAFVVSPKQEPERSILSSG